MERRKIYFHLLLSIQYVKFLWKGIYKGNEKSEFRIQDLHLLLNTDSCLLIFPDLRFMQLPTAGLLAIRDRRLLLAFSKNKKCFYLPGGKVDKNETPAQALCREIEEELNVSLQESELSYYTHITAPAYSEVNGTIMEQDCFLINKTIDAIASAEIGELKYFTLTEYLAQSQTAPGAIKILEILTENNLID